MKNDELENLTMADQFCNTLTHIDELCVLSKEIRKNLDEYYEHLLDIESTLDIHMKALDRATKVWREETGNTDILPDTSKLVQWLLNTRPNTPQSSEVDVEISKLDAENDRQQQELRNCRMIINDANELCKSIIEGYPNQDIDHVDFRVQVTKWAEGFLERHKTPAENFQPTGESQKG